MSREYRVRLGSPGCRRTDFGFRSRSETGARSDCWGDTLHDRARENCLYQDSDEEAETRRGGPGGPTRLPRAEGASWSEASSSSNSAGFTGFTM